MMRILIVLLLALLLAAGDAGNAQPVKLPEPGTVDQARVEQFLQKFFDSKGGGRVIVEPKRYPSPIPWLEEARFVVDAAGLRKPGVVYITGDKLIFGQLIDLTSETNLTAQGLGPPTKIIYKPGDFDLKERLPRGSADPMLTLVEYSDFQCPFCEQQHQTLQTLMAKYPDQVRLYYKHFPLSKLHPLAYSMALAVECARDQKAEAFWALHDDFFTNQYRGGDANALTARLRDWAAKNGLDGDRLIGCVEKREPADRVEADLREGRRLGAGGTPALIANGEFLNGAQPLEVLESFLKPSAGPPTPSAPAVPKK